MPFWTIEKRVICFRPYANCAENESIRLNTYRKFALYVCEGCRSVLPRLISCDAMRHSNGLSWSKLGCVAEALSVKLKRCLAEGLYEVWKDGSHDG